MKSRSVRHLRVRLAALGLAAAAAVIPSSRALAEPDRAAVDAQCPWGRLADGHGKLVRCLTSEEATHLRESPGAPTAAPPVAEAPLKPPAAAAVAPAEPIGKASDAIWPLPSKLPTAEPAPAPPAPPADELTAEIGSVVADSGALSDSARALRKMRDRLVECAAKNGGLTADRADVELRFLVQERGRAEGVSIKKKRGLGDAAAKCVADVLDRRFVGYPDEPAVGASLVVTLAKKKK